ncbi:MAG: aminotransferase class III-fold pyridoxal phosphate-dependent enzyme [Planctomycetota bacterium]
MKIFDATDVTSGIEQETNDQSFASATCARSELLAAVHATLEKEIALRCPQSLQLYNRALAVFPGGVTHDNRHVAGPSLFMRKAEGACKTDQDGRRYVDYWVGHGSLILGHCHREVIEAIHLAAQDMTHPGACHEREVLWGEQVRAMVPSAERVRFTASGSEATALAVRLARAMTGKNMILKFEGHFHGWLDHAVEGVDLPFESPWSAGVPDAICKQTVVLPARDLELVEEALLQRHDIAGIILEPTGASGGTIPIRPDFLRGLRELTTRYGVALIFDEVITGFRLAPGGAQQKFNILPDITCLAKILAGGMPGGAVCGSREAFAAMEFSGDAKKDRLHRVAQYGTFNAAPVSAAAGVTTLRLVQDGTACQKAERAAIQLRNDLNTLFRREGLPWAAYGISSVFHILTSDPATGSTLRDGKLDAADIAPTILKQKGPLDNLLRRALLLEGVDLPPGRQAWVSVAHRNEEIAETVDAFAQAIQRLRTLRCL